MNPGPLGPEPSALPNCATPRPRAHIRHTHSIEHGSAAVKRFRTPLSDPGRVRVAQDICPQAEDLLRSFGAPAHSLSFLPHLHYVLACALYAAAANVTPLARYSSYLILSKPRSSRRARALGAHAPRGRSRARSKSAKRRAWTEAPPRRGGHTPAERRLPDLSRLNYALPTSLGIRAGLSFVHPSSLTRTAANASPASPH